MIPYILLIFLPLLFSFLRFSTRNGVPVIQVGGSRRILESSCVLPVYFFLLILLLSLRHDTLGTDLVSYKYYFRRIAALSFGNLGRMGLEDLYVVLNWLISRVTSDFQVFLAVIAIITVLPIAWLYCEDREHGFLKIILFMNMSNFVLLFSGLRQCVALAVGCLAFHYVREKKPLRFALTALIALGFHHSAFMIFLYYPLYYANFKKKHLWYVIPAILLVFVFNRPIFSMVVNILSMFSNEKYAADMSNTGAYTMLLLFIAFAVFSYVIADEKHMDREALGLRNYLLTAVVLQGFAPLHPLAMRLNYYYILFIPILIPKIFKNAKQFPDDVVLFMKTCFVAFFTAYYLYSTYISCKTGISALDTYPYIPFWK